MAWYSILPRELVHLESLAVSIFFFLGLVTIGPWAFLVLLDATIWLYSMILWELPCIGGRARGRQRPRAPTLNERPDGQRRAFGLRGVEDGDHKSSELGNILGLGSDALGGDTSRLNTTGLNPHPGPAGDGTGTLKQRSSGQS